MKTTFTLIALLFSTHAFAQTPNANANLPICNEDLTVVPCKFSKKDSFAIIPEMMFGNRKGFNQIASKAPGQKSGLTDGFTIEDARVSIVKHEQVNHFGYRNTTVYELLLNDCRGTDACNGIFLWTVTELTEGDGYTYESKYTNTLTKSDLHELDPESESK